MSKSFTLKPGGNSLKAETGHYEIQGTDATLSANVSEAVELESKIPPDARKAVRKFIEEQIRQLSEAVSDFIVNIPDQLVQYTEEILEIICKLTGWC